MTEFAKNAQKPCQAFFSKKHPKIEQISDDFKSNLLYAALPKGHVEWYYDQPICLFLVTALQLLDNSTNTINTNASPS